MEESSLLGGGEGVGLLSLTGVHDGMVRMGLFSFLFVAMTCKYTATSLHSIDPKMKLNNVTQVYDIGAINKSQKHETKYELITFLKMN